MYPTAVRVYLFGTGGDCGGGGMGGGERLVVEVGRTLWSAEKGVGVGGRGYRGRGGIYKTVTARYPASHHLLRHSLPFLASFTKKPLGNRA